MDKRGAYMKEYKSVCPYDCPDACGTYTYSR